MHLSLLKPLHFSQASVAPRTFHVREGCLDLLTGDLRSHFQHFSKVVASLALQVQPLVN